MDRTSPLDVPLIRLKHVLAKTHNTSKHRRLCYGARKRDRRPSLIMSDEVARAAHSASSSSEWAPVKRAMCTLIIGSLLGSVDLPPLSGNQDLLNLFRQEQLQTRKLPIWGQIERKRRHRSTIYILYIYTKGMVTLSSEISCFVTE